jgi:glycosyltransferase involved in cell wall biosynthesis
MDISVVLSTYNRSGVLPRALECFARQEAPAALQYEFIVVDNNSTDGTKTVVESFAARDQRFCYVFEPLQGLSHARNCGIKAARAEIVAFTDDDVEVAPDWIAQVHRAMCRYPEAEFVGGRVRSSLNVPLPDWAHANMAPLALQDLGKTPLRLDSGDRRCLIGACLAIRRRAFERYGMFSIETQRVKDGVGSTEDADWETQVWNRGGHGMYVPDIVVHSSVSQERLRKSYHRRWHLGHGKFNAKARRPEFETARRVLDVPVFVYRQAVQNWFEFALLSVTFNKIGAFERENRFLFSLGFIAERWRTQLLRPQAGRRAATANSLAG